MTKPMDEAELKDKIAKVYTDAHTEGPECIAKDWPDVFAEKVVKLVRADRKAYGEYVIGENEHTDPKRDPGYLYYKGRNDLRAEQRQRNRKEGE